MLESGAVIAGTTVGSAAGKKVSDGINTSLKRTGGVLETAAKSGAKPSAKTSSVARPPLLQVGAGVPRPEPNNVPPPPPRRRTAAPRPAPVSMRTVSVPMAMASVIPETPQPLNVDLSGIQKGMIRDAVLALGTPSARITMFEDGHMLEIYQYRNQSLASGSVRLRDGSVDKVEARP